MGEPISPFGVFFWSFVVAGLAGLAALLRSGHRITPKGIASYVLNTGMLGLGISLFWYTKFRDNAYFLIGICLLAGLGGMTTVDFVLTILQSGGIHVHLSKGEAKK